MIGLIIALGLLLVLSAFFSATETAYTGMNVVRMRHLAKERRAAARALKLYDNYDKILSTILIGNNIVNIASASIATVIFVNWYGDAGVLISTVAMTLAVLIFGEVTPKSIAKERPEAFAMAFSVPLKFFYIVFSPLNFLFNAWKKLLIKLFRLDKNKPAMTEDEFKIILSDIREDGVLNEVEHNLINNTLKYDETLAASIMTPIDNAVMVDVATPFDGIKEIFEETSYSRVPIFENARNNIIGVLYLADFYELVLNKGTSIRGIMKAPLWTDGNVKISALFARLQKHKQHIAMVGTSDNVVGLITMEDILEELVGEIEDESD